MTFFFQYEFVWFLINKWIK